jgi:hypothetical protein
VSGSAESLARPATRCWAGRISGSIPCLLCSAVSHAERLVHTRTAALVECLFVHKGLPFRAFFQAAVLWLCQQRRWHGLQCLCFGCESASTSPAWAVWWLLANLAVHPGGSSIELVCCGALYALCAGMSLCLSQGAGTTRRSAVECVEPAWTSARGQPDSLHHNSLHRQHMRSTHSWLVSPPQPVCLWAVGVAVACCVGW